MGDKYQLLRALDIKPSERFKSHRSRWYVHRNLYFYIYIYIFFWRSCTCSKNYHLFLSWMLKKKQGMSKFNGCVTFRWWKINREIQGKTQSWRTFVMRAMPPLQEIRPCWENNYSKDHGGLPHPRNLTWNLKMVSKAGISFSRGGPFSGSSRWFFGGVKKRIPEWVGGNF